MDDGKMVDEENESNDDLNINLAKELSDIKNEIADLKDLFVRRLNNDKQKAELIENLEKTASFAYIEPFISELILLLDRLEKKDDDFSFSVFEELYGILERRGFNIIKVKRSFDPSLYKAVKVIEDEKIDKLQVKAIVRSGYTFSDRVVRPAEVVVARPLKHNNNDSNNKTADENEGQSD